MRGRTHQVVKTVINFKLFFLLLPESLKVWTASIQPKEFRWFYEPNGNIDREFKIFRNER